MAAVVRGGRGAGSGAWRLEALPWGWLLWVAVLLAGSTAVVTLSRSALPPASGATAVEGAARRLAYSTTRLIEAVRAGDASATAERRRQLIADADATAPALAARQQVARRPVAGQWYADEVERARAYARAAVGYARAGAGAGDVRQLERAGTLCLLALRTLAGAGGPGRGREFAPAPGGDPPS
jgi:hypothetical protein